MRQHHRDVASLITRSSGARQTRLGMWSVDYSADCDRPVLREFVGRPAATDGRWVTIGPGKRNTLYMDMTLRCRSCESCLRARSRHWSARARAELEASARTWFGTLTLRPEAQFHFLTVARQKAALKAEDFETFTESQIFAARVAAIGAELGKFLKRVRKNSKAELRYLLVAEAHSSGLPHFHILIHQSQHDEVVTHAELTRCWRVGFSKFKLVAPTESKVVYYVTKYLAKSILARVRASLGYGRESATGYDPKTKTCLNIANGVTTDPHINKVLLNETAQTIAER